MCLQETKVQDADFPISAFEELGYNVIFKGEKSYNGVAIVSKEKPLSFSFGFKDGLQADETRLIYARYSHFHLFNTYVPQGREITHEMYEYKIEWFKRLLNLFSQKFKSTDKILWAGDLNIAPEAIDIHNAEAQKDHVCFHIEVRNAFKKVMDWGFVDLFRKFHPSERKYTFFDYRTPEAVQKNMGWRVDHILSTVPLANLCKKCEIDLEPRKQPKASDHTILFSVFELKSQ
jgi:exodeoxyribonuclease-3